MLDILEIIIKWLQVSVSSECNRQTLKIWFVSRDLVLSDRATCTIASRVNSFDFLDQALPQFLTEYITSDHLLQPNVINNSKTISSL